MSQINSTIEENITQIAGTLAGSYQENKNMLYVSQEDTEGEYGVFSLSEDGEYSYIIDNSNAKIENLKVGEILQDEIIIESINYLGEKIISIFTINIEGTSEFPSAYSEDYFIGEQELFLDYFENGDRDF